MKEQDELKQILELIRKFNLPLSPILEYAIKEKIEEFQQINIANGDEEVNDLQDKDDANTCYHDNDAGILSQNNNIKWFCLSILSCVEDEMDKRNYQILLDKLNGDSLSEIASRLQLTRERVRQIVVKATKQVKELLTEQHNRLATVSKENIKLKVQADLLREDIARMKALLPKDAIEGNNNGEKDLDDALVELLETPISETNLPVRAVNVFNRINISKFADIPQIGSSQQLFNIKNSGKKTVHDVLLMLKDFNLTFGMSYNEIVDVLKVDNGWSIASRKWLKKFGNNGKHNNKIKSSLTKDRTKTKEKSPKVIINENNSIEQIFRIISKTGYNNYISNKEIKYFNKKPYSIIYTNLYLTINLLEYNNSNSFIIKDTIIHAKYHTPLHSALDSNKYLNQIVDIATDKQTGIYLVKVSGVWYDQNGNVREKNNSDIAKRVEADNLPIFNDKISSNEDTNYVSDRDVKEKNNYDVASSKIRSLERLNKKHKIRVTYPNGRSFSSILVWKTLVDVIKYAGAARVNQLNIKYLGDNLVTPHLNENPQYRRAQKGVGNGMYVNTYSSTEEKIKQIERINEELQLGLIIEKTYQRKLNGNLSQNSNNIMQDTKDKRIGYVVRLFPSQQVGMIVNTKVDEKGKKKLVVRTNEDSTMMIDDLPYLYEILRREANNEIKDKADTIEKREIVPTEEATIVLTREIIEAARTPNGGFTKSQLAALGIEWPAPKDWIDTKVGMMITPTQLADFNRIIYVKKSNHNI